jgi:lathosterol oxidase
MIVSITMFDGPGNKAGMSTSASSDDIRNLGGSSSPKLGPMSRRGSKSCLSTLGMESLDLGPTSSTTRRSGSGTARTPPRDFTGVVAAVHEWLYPSESKYFWYREGKVHQSDMGVKYINLVLFALLGGTAGSGLLMGWIMYGIYLLNEYELAPLHDPAAFVPFALSASLFTSSLYYWSCSNIENQFYNARMKEKAQEWKCQPDNFLSDKHHREEVVWGMFNAGWAGVLGTGIFYGHLNGMWNMKLYYDVNEHGWWDFVRGFVLVFFWIDLWAYFAHRFLHQKSIYKYVHKWHHRYIAPTSFSAFGMHPIEFTIFQCGGIFCCFLFRIHVMAFLVNATYVAYHGQIDHSGIYFEGDLPWQPSTKYHDDHHKYFHLNFGQNLILWDWMFGTLRESSRVYGEDIFVADTPVPIDTAKKLQ